MPTIPPTMKCITGRHAEKSFQSFAWRSFQTRKGTVGAVSDTGKRVYGAQAQKVLAAQSKTAGKPKAKAKPEPKQQATQTAAVYERAANDPSLSFPDIDRHVASLRSLPKAQLVAVAKQVDVTPASGESKESILNRVSMSIKDRKARTERTHYGKPVTAPKPIAPAKPPGSGAIAKVESLYHRARDPKLTVEEIDSAVNELARAPVADVDRAARAVDITRPGSRRQKVEWIRRAIRERMGAYRRVDASESSFAETTTRRRAFLGPDGRWYWPI